MSYASTLRLFRAIQIEQPTTGEIDSEVLKGTLAQGYILDPAIPITEELLREVNQVIGLAGDQVNASFHKSWEKIRSADIEQLVLEQIAHYWTTYGLHEVGLYHPSTVYIPGERLEIPSVSEDIPVTYIRALCASEIQSEIVKLGAGAALSESTLTDILNVVQANEFPADYLADISNHELLCRLYVYYDLVPDDPVDYLRYVIFRITGQSLLIKNDALLDLIKSIELEQSILLDELVERSPPTLSKIFYRFKPVFLAMKSVSNNKAFFNRLRKQAVKFHEPLAPDYLATVTQQIKEKRIDLDVLSEHLDKASVFRVIRLAYALDYRLQSNSSIVYPIRNGRGWACKFNWPASLHSATSKVFDIVVKDLQEKLKRKVYGREFYIPEYVSYALPLSEKQFAGPFPSASYIETNRELVFGIHWTNFQERQTDLDLSLLSATKKIGWDGQYRSEDVMFSGDLTDAPEPNGATELFYVRDASDPLLVMCNYYNFSTERPVTATLIVANDAPKHLCKNYLINTNKIVAKIPLTISKKQTVLGLVQTLRQQTRFYVANVSIGCGITSTETEVSVDARKYLTAKYASSQLNLVNLLRSAGATVIRERGGSDTVDLAPENLSQSKLLNLLF